MPIFVMLTRVPPEMLQSPRSLEDMEKQAAERVRAECPEVRWLHSYALLGPHDYLDVFEAPDPETAAKVSTLIRAHGRAHTETYTALEWARYKEQVRDLSEAEGRDRPFGFRRTAGGALEPVAEEQAAVDCMLRARSEGKSLPEIAEAVRIETGLELTPEAVDRILREAAGPVPRREGGDPEFFSGYLGGG
jgi:uncharacterized protein with GYD domain